MEENEIIFPSDTVAQLLDAIAKDAKEDPKNIHITSLEADHKDAFETYMDMVRKRRIITREQNTPLPLSNAPSVAQEYTAITRKRTPQLLSMSEIYKEDSSAVFPMTDELCRLKLKLVSGTAIVLLSSAEPMSEAKYLRAVEGFVSCEGLSDKIMLARKISYGGIISALADITSGALVDISAIPDIPETPSILHLVSEHRGGFILAIQRSHVEFSSVIAEYYGLSLVHFAKVIHGEKLVFLPANDISDTVHLPLVRMLSSAPLPRAVRIAEESVTHDPLSLVFEARGSNAPKDNSYGTIYLRNGTVSTVCAAKLKEAPFYASLFATLNATLPMIAAGVGRGDISLKVRYTLPDTVSDEAIGASLASMLGVYRVMSELYISGESAVGYTSECEPSVAVAAFSSSKNTRVLKKLIKENSGVYLLSFDRTECGLPSFASFRGMCDFYRECVDNKYVLSAAAVNGSIKDTLDAMRSDFECKIADSAEPFLNKSVCGIIVESEIPMRHGVFLGSTTRLIDEL